MVYYENIICGRFILSATQSELEEFLGRKFQRVQHAPRFNIAPGSQVLTIKQTEPDEVQAMRWGMKPPWWKQKGRELINIRAESLKEKPLFRRALLNQRCIVLADGFYEWGKIGKIRQPYFFCLTDHRPFAFLCLFELEDDGEACAIATVPANSLVGKIHDRMPAILNIKEISDWLDPKNDQASILKMLKPFASKDMKAEAVNRAVNSPSVDDPKFIFPKRIN